MVSSIVSAMGGLGYAQTHGPQGCFFGCGAVRIALTAE